MDGTEFLTGYEVDRLVRWRSGRAYRLAKAKRLPHVVLPDGSIRFRREEVLDVIESVPIALGCPPASEGGVRC